MKTFIGNHHALPKGSPVTVEGLWKDLVHKSWRDSYTQGNPAAIVYMVRVIVHQLPRDDDVYYVHDQSGIGHLVHATELKE
jgi:hypothetical protein